MDENANPGNYGFRLVGGDKPHFFSSPEQQVVREWMKALMKATIARDYSVAVTSSCNIPTIPLAEAQAMSPRPPSPASRDAAQRANRRENTNTLTPHDANVLVSCLKMIRAECRCHWIPRLDNVEGQVNRCRPTTDLRPSHQLLLRTDPYHKPQVHCPIDECPTTLRLKPNPSDHLVCHISHIAHPETSVVHPPTSIVKHS